MARREWPAEARAFLSALSANLDEKERLITCGVLGDPGKAASSQWRPRPWTGDAAWCYPTGWNAYVTVGAFSVSPDGSYRRRAANCTGGVAFMVDDVGTKVSRSRVEHTPPSAIVETSRGNEQWWYFLDKVERDTERFDALIRAFIDTVLGGEDPGMASVTRVGRIPGFSNNKAAYGPVGVDVKLLSLSDKRFSVEELLSLYGLSLVGRRRVLPRILPDDAEERIKAHYLVRKFLRLSGMLKRSTPDPSGWLEIQCPWVDGHTAGVDNGAAIREPDQENGFYGGFRCHHGSCAKRGWRELTDWIADEASERLEQANAGTIDRG